MLQSSSSISLKAAVDALGGSIAVVCDHPKCNTPIAALIGNALVIKHRHHGEIHVSVLNIIAYASMIMT